MILKYDDAPEYVRKLAFALMQSIGRDLLNIPPEQFLMLGTSAGLDALSQTAAVQWITEQYVAHASGDRGSAFDRELAHDTAHLLLDYVDKLVECAARPAH